MPFLAAHGADVLPTCGGERAGCVIALLSGDLDLASAPTGRHTVTSMGDAENGIPGYALA
jgi:hypothetical protein